QPSRICSFGLIPHLTSHLECLKIELEVMLLLRTVSFKDLGDTVALGRCLSIIQIKTGLSPTVRSMTADSMMVISELIVELWEDSRPQGMIYLAHLITAYFMLTRLLLMCV